MKLELDKIQKGFDGLSRRIDPQVWLRIGPFVDVRLKPAADINTDTLDIGLDIDQDIPEDKAPEILGEATARIERAASLIAQAPVSYMTSILKTMAFHEVTVPAGCDPLDPVEIRSAVKRAVAHLGPKLKSNKVAILFGAGGQDAFFDALDPQTLPPTIEGVEVDFHPITELLDERAVMELFPPTTGETTDKPAESNPEDYVAKLREAGRRSAWFIIPHFDRAAMKPFEYTIKHFPKLIGPNLKVGHACQLTLRDDSKIVRVAPSKIVLASSTPKAMISSV